MKTLTTLFLVLWSIQATSQKHSIGIFGGLSLADVKSQNWLGSDEGRIGSIWGIGYQLQLNDNYQLGADLIYIQKGYKGYQSYLDASGNPEPIEAKHYFDYISIPIKGGYSLGQDLSVFANLGVVPALLIQAKNIVSPYYGMPNGDVRDMKESLNSFDFSGIFEIGATYNFSAYYTVSTCFAYQRSFTSLTTEYYFANSEIWHHGLNISLGLKYTLPN
jgi:hypothetical protein